MEPATDAQLNDIENEIRNLATRMDNMSSTLDEIRDFLRMLGKGHEPQPDNIPPPPQNTAEDNKEFVLPPSGPKATADLGLGTQVSDQVQPNWPTAFDGKHMNGSTFLNSCHLYMTICAAELKDGETCINWMLLYMNLGHAAKLSGRVLCHLTNTGSPMFTDLSLFVWYFVTNFCLVDEEMTA